MTKLKISVLIVLLFFLLKPNYEYRLTISKSASLPIYDIEFVKFNASNYKVAMTLLDGIKKFSDEDRRRLKELSDSSIVENMEEINMILDRYKIYKRDSVIFSERIDKFDKLDSIVRNWKKLKEASKRSYNTDSTTRVVLDGYRFKIALDSFGIKKPPVYFHSPNKKHDPEGKNLIDLVESLYFNYAKEPLQPSLSGAVELKN